MPYDQNSPTGKSLFERHIELLGRVEDLERQMQGVRKDWEFADYEPPVVKPQEVIMAGEDPQDFAPDILTPPQIEFGKPTAPVTTDVATVTLQPCDQGGTSFANAATVTVYVANDRQTQETSGRGWTTSTILSFIRFMPWVAGSPNKEGVLIGEANFTDLSDLIAADTGILFSEWLHIEGNVNNQLLDLRNWSGRAIKVQAMSVSGSGCTSDPAWNHQHIDYWTRDANGGPPAPAWVNAVENDWWKEITNLGIAAQNIARIDDGALTATITMDTSGWLDITVAGHVATDHYMKATIWGDKRREEGDRVGVGP